MLTGRLPPKLFVESSASCVPGKDPQPRTLNATSPHPIEHRVMCGPGHSGTPVLDGGPEVQDLVAPDRSETHDSAFEHDHVAVDARPRDLLQPTLRYVVARKRVGILREHAERPRTAPGSWTSSTSGTSAAVIARRRLQSKVSDTLGSYEGTDVLPAASRHGRAVLGGRHRGHDPELPVLGSRIPSGAACG